MQIFENIFLNYFLFEWNALNKFSIFADVMRPTIQYVTEKFNEFNKLCFKGSLPLPPIVMSSSRRSLGMITYHSTTCADGSKSFSNFTFRISNLIDRDERIVEDTILHEMIHYYILWHKLEDSSAHGHIFRRIMNQINLQFGRNITISHRSTAMEHDSDTQKRHHLVCLLRFLNGDAGVMVVVPNRLIELWNTPMLLREVVSYQWYHTTDPFFNRYPHVRTTKAYHISNQDATLHLEHAVKLENIDGRIRPIK